MIQKHFTDNTNERSVASRLRKQRFQLFVDMLNKSPCPASVLDIGGTQKYWEVASAGLSLMNYLQITLLNIQPQFVSLPNFTSVVGDARAMPQFANNQFNMVFSNSTIEHVGDFDSQMRMAKEVMRVGKRYYIQTPNRYFPIEPHFVFPFFQFLPVSIRVWLVRTFKLGWFPKIQEQQKAFSEVTGIRLISRHEIKMLFPNAIIFDEKYLGLTKSFVAYTPD
jgi:SAM-dependent methyltransferase